VFALKAGQAAFLSRSQPLWFFSCMFHGAAAPNAFAEDPDYKSLLANQRLQAGGRGKTVVSIVIIERYRRYNREP